VQLEIETDLALHVAEEQGANKHLVQLEPQFLHHNVAPRTLLVLVLPGSALERRSAALVVRRSASFITSTGTTTTTAPSWDMP
jgi:hypothetical protein